MRNGKLNWLLVAITLFFIGCTSTAGEEGNHQTDSIPETDSIAIDTTSAPPKPKTLHEYEQAFQDAGLVDIRTVIPDIAIDLKYASEDNFLDTAIYGDMDKCYLRQKAADKLKAAQELLQEKKPGYSLVVFDGARPRRVQFIMWKLLDVPYKLNYLADPKKGSIHNYGFAVDLSIVDENGKQLDMGTPFDFFGPLAQPQLENKFLASGELTEAQHENRKLLREVMKKSGFYDIRTEWWHFNALPSSYVKANYEIID